VWAVCPGQVGHTVATLLRTFGTDLGQDELAVRVALLFDLWQDIANFICERILQGHIAGTSPLEILHEITLLTELFSTALQHE